MSEVYDAAQEIRGAIQGQTEELQEVTSALDSIASSLLLVTEQQGKPIGYEYCYAANPAEASVLGREGWRAIFHIPASFGNNEAYVWMERGIWVNDKDE